jgi:hydrogenase nickel incorporation protein HypA/HybF
MHELSIANAILDAVRKEAEKRPGAHVTEVGVRIGALAGVELEALRFGFDVLVRGSDLDPLALVIEPVPRRQRCPQCEFTFEVREGNAEGPESDHPGPATAGPPLLSKEGSSDPGLGTSDSGLRTSDSGLSLACPRCGRPETLFAGGDELDLVYLELESPESDHPGPASA